MDDVIPDAEQWQDGPDGPGALLRRAREARGMSIADVAEVTRIAQRQLEAIERSDFASLPGTPYAVGFARAYARAVGADEVAVARGVREELGTLDSAQRHEAFEPVDPARIPPRNLAWVAAAIALVLAVGYGIWRTQFFAVSTDQEISDLSNRASEQAALPSGQSSRPAAADDSAASTPVVLTAREDVWLRIYDQAGERLLEKQMVKGESYTVPPLANNPMILTGRPDAIGVTVGGKPVAPLGPPDRTIADVPISATALLARSSGSGPPSAPGPVSTAPQPTGQGDLASVSQPAQAQILRRPATETGQTSLNPATARVLQEAESAATSLAPLQTGD